jgi:hypothetical protein
VTRMAPSSTLDRAGFLHRTKNLSVVRVDHEEDLIPASVKIPDVLLRSPWFRAALLLLAGFVALGVWSESIPGAPHVQLALMRPAFIVFDVVGIWVPAFGALILVWAAFASPRWSDRFLWSAAMIFTAQVLAGLASEIFPRAMPSGTTYHTYPTPYAVVGATAYGTWLLNVDRSTLAPRKKQGLGLLCLLAIIFIAAYPLINPAVRPIDIAGAFLFAATGFSFGMLAADRVGVRLLDRDEDQSAETSERRQSSP